MLREWVNQLLYLNNTAPEVEELCVIGGVDS